MDLTTAARVGVLTNTSRQKQLLNAGSTANVLLLKTLLRVMKLTTIFILAITLHAAAKSSAQNLSISEKNASLKSVFKEIEKQSGYQFFYNDKLLKDTRKVSIQVKNATLQQVLDLCFAGQPLTYSIVEKIIVVKQKEDLSPAGGGGNDRSELTGVDNNMPPPIDITGKVTDADGNPLVGATVKVKGSNKATTTNNDGVFVLKGVDDNAMLEISFVGYETLNMPVNGRTAIVTTLKMEVKNMNEVIINKGYYTEKARNTVGNVTHIDSKAIEQQPVQNPLLALQGRVTGIQITQLTGLNGGGVKAQIQGRNSLQFGVNPLIVVDGVPFFSEGLYANTGQESLVQGGSPLNYINMNDIESIDVLKDADATSIYGSRAANGAILITTKKGKAGKTKLSVNLQQGWSKVARFADMLNTRQYLDMRYERYRNDGIDPSTLTFSGSNLDLTFWDTTRYTNWQKELIGGKAKYTNVSANISGGNTLMNYLIGGSFNRRTTVFPGDFDDRQGGLHFSINGNSANQKLTVGLTGSYMYDDNHLPGEDLTAKAVYLEPVAPALHKADGTLNWAQLPDGRSTWVNPLAYIENKDFKNTSKSLVSNMTVNYQLYPGFSIGSSFGYTSLQNDIYTPGRIEQDRPERRASSLRGAQFGKRDMSTWIIEPNAQYTGSFGKGKLDAMIGGTLQKNNAQFIQITGLGFASDQLMGSVTNAPIRTVDIDPSFQYKYAALFGRLGYTLNGKYLVNATARRDGSSRYGNKNRFSNFWSVGTGWIFSEEAWIKQHAGFVSFGKLRISYGKTGNDQIGDYLALSYYSLNNPSVPYQGISGLQVQSLPNPNLQWEGTNKWQGGIDLGFFRDRVVLGVTYALNQSSNQIGGYFAPTITGFSTVGSNLPAIIRNTSWEITLHTANIKGRDFNWSSDFNVTIPQNKLAKFPNIENSPFANKNNPMVVGQPLGGVYVFRYAGIDPATGEYTVFDRNGTPVVIPDELDKTELVYPSQKFYGGWLHSLHYKGWQLDALFQFVYKKDNTGFYYGNPDSGPGLFAPFTNGANQPVSVLNHWQKPGDNAPIGRYSTNRYFPPRDFLYLSDAIYTYDASFIRLKNVSLNWQLPTTWLKKARLQNGTVYFRGENLATFTKFAGMDPENINATSLPPLQTWTVGVNLNF